MQDDGEFLEEFVEDFGSSEDEKDPKGEASEGETPSGKM